MRNTRKSDDGELRAPAAPESPIVAGPPLDGPQLSFIEFLEDRECKKFCALLFGGTNTSAGTALAEFRKATVYHYYGHRRRRRGNPGKLTAPKSADKKALKDFARRAYRGDPDKRGAVFWERVAWLVWQTYYNLMRLRLRAARIKQQEVRRIEDLPKKRALRASYMRRYRDKQRAKAGRHVKKQARAQWRRRIGLAAPSSESESRSRKLRT